MYTGMQNIYIYIYLCIYVLSISIYNYKYLYDIDPSCRLWVAWAAIGSLWEDFGVPAGSIWDVRFPLWAFLLWAALGSFLEYYKDCASIATKGARIDAPAHTIY